MIAWLAMGALAEPYRAGHHHAEYRWYTIETRWVRVHYPVGGGAHPVDASGAAQRVAAVADELLLRLGDHTGWIPHGPIDVVVTDEADEMTAYTLPAWGWIVLSADPGVDVGRLRGPRDWIRSALAHELGHVVAERLSSPFAPTANYGIEGIATGTIGPVQLGGDADVGPNEPFGWSEGAAEAWSEAAGVRSWSPARSALLRTSALSDRLLSWDEWVVAVDKDDLLDAERAYQQGNAFARWLVDQYGEDVFVRMAEVTRRRYHGSWATALRAVTGEPARVTWGRWRGSVVADALAEAARISARGRVEGTQIERSTLAWEDPDLDRKDLWASRGVRDREQDREGTGSFELFPQTSADGRWYAEGKVGWVHVERGDPADWPVASYPAIRVREARTNATSVWVRSAFGDSFSFVPGADALVVAAPEDAGRRWFAPTLRDPWLRLYRVDLEPDLEAIDHRGGKLEQEELQLTNRERRRRMTPIPGTLRARDPAVAPDGSRVAWLAYADGGTTLKVAKLDGSEPRSLSSFRAGTVLQRPSWSPDGSRIVVSVVDRGPPDLWVVELATGTWFQLTADPGDEVDPWWAADGIWFGSDRDGVLDIYRLDPETGAATRMTRTLGGAMTPFVDRRGDLLFTDVTADGYKAARIPRDGLAFDPVDPFTRPPPAEPSPAPPDAPVEPYRWSKSLLVPGASAMVRFDMERAGLSPTAGAYLRARDAVEKLQLTLQGLAGSDWLGDAALAWRGLPPELRVFGDGAVDRRRLSDGTWDRRGWGVVGVEAEQRIRDDLSATVSASAWSTWLNADPQVRSARAAVEVDAGSGPSRDSPRGAAGSLTLTRAWSEDLGAGSVTPWLRVEAEAYGAIGLRWALGPLDEQAMRIEWSLDGGITDREVHPDEQLYAGGDVPGALELDSPVASTPLPGFPAFALGGSTLGVGYAQLVVPAATRLRTSAGPLYLQGVDLAFGAGAAGNPEAILGSISADLRLSALLFDSPWDSVARIAWGIGDPGPPRSAGFGAGQVSGPSAGPHLYVGIGTGF